jgi:hypothetical protein
MRNYITRLSKEDFLKLYTSFILENNTTSFPQVVAFISDDYPALPNNKVTHIHIPSIKHIYSTRDYWEIELLTNSTRHKIPKRYTKAIYLIEED